MKVSDRNFATLILLTLIACALASTARAQFWAKQPFDQWSRRDCEDLLNNSPWTQSRIIEKVILEQIHEPASVAGREQPAKITYTVRLLSARPVRQAMVRLARLGPDYTKLTPEQRQPVDARQNAFIEQKFDDRVVIQIEYTTSALPYRTELVTRWRARPEEDLKKDFYLATARGRIPAARVIVAAGGEGGLQVIFPRVVEGRPVIQPDDKNFSLEFQHPTVGVLAAERVLIQFNVKDMLVKNELFY